MHYQALRPLGAEYVTTDFSYTKNYDFYQFQPCAKVSTWSASSSQSRMTKNISNMDGLSAFITVSKVVELSGQIAIECWKYYGHVKSARSDIERLRKEVLAFQDAAKEVKALLEGAENKRLAVPESILRSIEQCEVDLRDLEKQLQPSKMRKFGFRALKWPMSSKEIDKIVTLLKRHELSLITILNVNQMYSVPR